MPMTSKYRGKVCAKHPELRGLRWGASYACVECQAEMKRQPHLLARYRVRYREFLRRLKREVIDYYGGQCKRCNETDIDVLTLDHKKGDGAEHRRQLIGAEKGITSGGGAVTYRWAKKNGFPPLFRVLCFNCNVKLHLLRLRKAWR